MELKKSYSQKNTKGENGHLFPQEEKRRTKQRNWNERRKKIGEKKNNNMLPIAHCPLSKETNKIKDNRTFGRIMKKIPNIDSWSSMQECIHFG